MIVKGIPGSSGYAIGEVLVLKQEENIIEKIKIIEEEIENEIKKFHSGLGKAKSEYTSLKKELQTNLSHEEAKILDYYLLLLEDVAIVDATIELIKTKRYSAEYAFNKILDELIVKFENISNDYFKERVYELKEFKNRILNSLIGKEKISIKNINKEVIIVAESLSVSDTAQMDPKYIKAFVTDSGGPTSHAAILARQLGIPAVLGTKNLSHSLYDGEKVIVDGFKGTVIIKPTADELSEYENKIKSGFNINVVEIDKDETNLFTKDGKEINLALNYSIEMDKDFVPYKSLKGVGLLRTEYLLISEQGKFDFEDQKFYYENISKKFEPDEVVVRLFDIGGDKFLESSDIVIEEEKNPFLGLRGIRLLFEYRHIFKEQIKAIFAANYKYGNLKIMLPMVACIEEVKTTKELLKEAEHELRKDHIAFKRTQLGIMIETPSVAIMSDLFAKEVDFFSIGTNDLTQYVMAVDRNNSNVAYLYNSYHPAVLRFIRITIQNAHKRKIPVAVCGEMAGDPLGAAVLIGMGIDKLSMNRSNLKIVHNFVKKLDYSKLKRWVVQIMKLSSYEEVLEFLSNKLEV